MASQEHIQTVAKMLARATSENPSEAEMALRSAKKRMDRDGVTILDLLRLDVSLLYKQTLVRLIDLIVQETPNLDPKERRELFDRYFEAVVLKFSGGAQAGQGSWSSSSGQQSSNDRRAYQEQYEQRRREEETRRREEDIRRREQNAASDRARQEHAAHQASQEARRAAEAGHAARQAAEEAKHAARQTAEEARRTQERHERMQATWAYQCQEIIISGRNQYDRWTNAFPSSFSPADFLHALFGNRSFLSSVFGAPVRAVVLILISALIATALGAILFSAMIPLEKSSPAFAKAFNAVAGSIPAFTEVMIFLLTFFVAYIKYMRGWFRYIPSPHEYGFLIIAKGIVGGPFYVFWYTCSFLIAFLSVFLAITGLTLTHLNDRKRA